MMIIDTLSAIERAVNGTPGLRFVTWTEILEGAPESTKRAANPFAISAFVSHYFERKQRTEAKEVEVIPDGLFGIEYATQKGERKTRYFVLEAERTNDVWANDFDGTSWLKKVLAYRDIIKSRTYETHLGIENLRVIAVAPERHKMQQMMDLVSRVTQGQGSTRFLFQHIPVLGYEDEKPVPLDRLFTTPWPRVGYLPFRLDMWEQEEVPT